MKAIIIFALAASLFGCADRCYVRQADAHYAVTAPVTTPKGIVEQGADPVLLDRIVDEVEACLLRLPPLAESKCWKVPIDRRSFRVVVATDYNTDADGEQTLPVYAGMGCKGQTGKCYWRALLQPDRVIVTTPNLKLFPDPLIRMVLGVQNIWDYPALAACAMPSAGRQYTPAKAVRR